MSRKQDENMLRERRHKKALEEKRNRDPQAKRLRQRYTTEGLKVQSAGDFTEKLKAVLAGKAKPDDLYRVDTSRGRRSIARAEAQAKKLAATPAT